MSVCRRGLLAFVFMLLLSSLSNAQSTTFIFDLDAAQVPGGSTSTAYGRGFATLDANNLLTVTIHHNVPNAAFIGMEFGALGVSGTPYNFFTSATSPAQLTFTLFNAADATTILNDGAYIQIYDASTAAIRGQITNKFVSQVFISEWCHDPIPPAQSVGIDTNLDGVQPTTGAQSDDEFVEIVNGSDQPVSLANWTISDANSVRHTFPAGTMLMPGESITVFGGGNLTNFIGQGLQAQSASTFTLGLNNSGGDSITIADGLGGFIDSISYVDVTPGDTDGESTTLVPAIPGGVQTPTTMTLNNLTHTPGFRSGGDYPWSTVALPGPAYAGNGTGAEIVVGINGSLSVTPTNVHDVNGGDIVQLTFRATATSLLTGTPFVAILQPFATGFPAPPSAFPGDAVPTIRYSGGLPTIVLADGLTNPFLPLSPVLGFYTASGIIPPIYGGTNNSFMIMLITFDPGRNMLDLGNAEAHELRVL